MEKMIVRRVEELRGDIKISGSKNATLPILMASILSGDKCTFTNVPDLWDVSTTLRLLSDIGAKVERNGHKVTIDSEEVNHLEAPYELVKTMRASVLVMGPLLARFHQAKVSLPGGCAIGARPVDLHIKGLQKLGATIDISHGYIKARAKRLRGARIVFDMPTVGGTENVVMAAVLADGVSVLENCALEPEVVDLMDMLNAMGAKISGQGTSTVVIEGVDSLKPLKYEIIPDRIETGTLMCAVALTGGDAFLEGARADHLFAVVDKLREMGVVIEEKPNGLRVARREKLRPIKISTGPYPGFPTDMQAQFCVLAALADGQSKITETIFENRYMHVAELQRMGADIVIDGRTAQIKGVKKLQGAQVMATDLRASASLILAGLVAEGYTDVLRIYHLDRGYEKLEKKLRKLGASIRRMPGGKH